MLDYLYPLYPAYMQSKKKYAIKEKSMQSKKKCIEKPLNGHLIQYPAMVIFNRVWSKTKQNKTKQ